MPTDPHRDDEETTPPKPAGDGTPAPRYTGAAGGKPDPGVEAMLEVMRRLEIDLEQLRRELAWSQRLAALGSLAAVVAHEVNNTLTPVTSYAQLALESPGDAELTQKALESAVEGVARATRIAASVLGMVQDAPSGGGEACCLLQDTVDDALACLARDPARDGIAVTVDLPDVAVSIARGDLQQVLVNLLLNARKALLQSSGARRLSLTAQVVHGDAQGEADESGGEDSRASRGGPFVELVVADSGPGIPDAMRGRLFEAFSTSPIGGAGGVGSRHPSDDAQQFAERRRARAANEASSGERGTGLGLSICRDLMARAGGAIWADPPGDGGGPGGGRGAVFRLRLPLAA